LAKTNFFQNYSEDIKESKISSVFVALTLKNCHSLKKRWCFISYFIVPGFTFYTGVLVTFCPA